MLFCEGTRFTETKHAASMEVAKKKGLPLLKHHLLPRTKGFVHSVHGLKGKGTSRLHCIRNTRVTRLYVPASLHQEHPGH